MDSDSLPKETTAKAKEVAIETLEEAKLNEIDNQFKANYSPRIREAEIKLNIWMKRSSQWLTTHYTLSILSLVCSTTVAANPPFINENQRSVLALLSAISVGAVGLFSSQKKSQIYFAVWQRLDSTYNEYRHNPSDAIEGESKVLEAMRKGDEVLADSKDIY
ncbi:MAG: hypothetical protein AB4058_10015 [Microcystaceae cyanobacterium]